MRLAALVAALAVRTAGRCLAARARFTCRAAVLVAFAVLAARLLRTAISVARALLHTARSCLEIAAAIRVALFLRAAPRSATAGVLATCAGLARCAARRVARTILATRPWLVLRKPRCARERRDQKSPECRHHVSTSHERTLLTRGQQTARQSPKNASQKLWDEPGPAAHPMGRTRPDFAKGTVSTYMRMC